MAQNQNTVANPIVMDSRKFLGAINESTQAKIAFFENKVTELGKAIGRDWKLASFRIRKINANQQYSGDLYIEDKATHTYYHADCRRESGGNVVVENIKPIKIVEEAKQSLFSDNCFSLVKAIAENDQKGMATAFAKMERQRFSGRIVPLSGFVKTRDGVIRQIHVDDNNALGEAVKPKIISAIVESLRDRVVVEGGAVVAGTFSDGDPIKLPVTKWASRKLVGKQMREAARDAYWSTGFQNRIMKTAELVYEDKLSDAIKFIGSFLKENEEFTLLKRSEVQTLVENALAAKACFNQQLCNNVASLFYRTNLKVNRDTIIKEWALVAKKSENSTLLENVTILERTKNFEAAYDKFIESIFETISNREITAEALATTLSVLRDKTPKIRESHEMSSRLNDLIARLKEKELDDASIYEAEDLIATIQEELSANENLSDFDSIPGDDTNGTGDPLGATGATDAIGGDGAPVININSPLIQIGGSSAAGGNKEEAPIDDLGLEEPEDEEGGDLDELLTGQPGGNQQQPGQQQPMGQQPGGQQQPMTGMESRRRGKAVAEEWKKPWEKDESDESLDVDDQSEDSSDMDCDDCQTESSDPYAWNGKTILANLHDYGAPVIADAGSLQHVVTVMRQLAAEHRLVGAALRENLTELAKASIEAVGLRVPSTKLGQAVSEAVSSFTDAMQPDEDDMVEDQFKSPKIKPRGFAKSAFKPSNKKVQSESVKWSIKESTGRKGVYRGVPFVFDHPNGLPPAILSEDGSHELPIPEPLVNSAFAAAGIKAGDDKLFLSWLDQNIEQLRPLSESEDRALQEAIATITANGDGTISVEVDGDVDVSHNDDGMTDGDADVPGDMVFDSGEDGDLPPDDASDNLPPDMEVGGDEEEMKPVESIAPPEAEEDGGSDEMPDFGGDSLDDEEENDVVEDRDITSPQSSKYTKEVKGNKREMPKPKLPSDADDELEAIGPTLKKDDGTGTKPPVARKAD